jgi:hypothetical protein
MTNLRWTEAEDSIIAVVNYLYKDPYGLIVQKALANHRPFPFQSSVIAPTGQSFSQEKLRSDNSLSSNGVNNGPSSLFPMRTLKQVLDRVLWQQRNPQDTLFEAEAIIKQPRFAEYLTEFTEWRTNSGHRKNPSFGGNGSSLWLKQEENKIIDIRVEKDDDSMHVEVKVEPDDKSMPVNSQVHIYIYSYIFIYRYV